MPVILALTKLRQENCPESEARLYGIYSEFQASLGYRKDPITKQADKQIGKQKSQKTK